MALRLRRSSKIATAGAGESDGWFRTGVVYQRSLLFERGKVADIAA